MGKKSLRGNAMILVAAGMAVKFFGFFYRIYLANLIGAEGMGLFHLIMPIYVLVILTVTSGVSIAVSRIIAEESAKNENGKSIYTVIISIAVIFVVSSIISSILYVNLSWIVNDIINEPRTMKSLLILLPAIPFIAISSALKGYFYGKQDALPPAVSQVVEQIAKLMLVLIIASHFAIKNGEDFCLLATIGMIFGELVNLAVVLIIFSKKQKRLKKQPVKKVIKKRRILFSILAISAPISINKLIASLMVAVENILIPQRLFLYGLSTADSLQQYGRLTGMAFPLLFFPSTITMALATSLVPAISEATSKHRIKTANYQISRAIQSTLVLGFIFTTVFMCCADDIAELIYEGQKVGPIIYLMSFTCIFIYLLQTLMGILNGLGKEKTTLWDALIGNGIRIGFVVFGIPILGLKAYVLGIIISYMVVAMLDFAIVVRTTGIVIDFSNWFIKPAISSAVIIMSSKYIRTLISTFIKTEKVAFAANIAFIGGISVSMMFATGAYDFKYVLKLVPWKAVKNILPDKWDLRTGKQGIF